MISNFKGLDAQLLILKDICILPWKFTRKADSPKGLTSGDSWPQTPLAFLGKCPLKDYFYGISALLYSSQWRETKRLEKEGATCCKGLRQDLNPGCNYCTWPALWATDLPRHSKWDLIIQLSYCSFRRLCTSQRSWKAKRSNSKTYFYRLHRMHILCNFKI